MTTKQAPYYWLTCDHEGCDAQSTEGDDFTAYADDDFARSNAHDSGWESIDGPDGTYLDYCEEHAREHVCGECQESNEGSSAEREWMCARCWEESQSGADPADVHPSIPQ